MHNLLTRKVDYKVFNVSGDYPDHLSAILFIFIIWFALNMTIFIKLRHYLIKGPFIEIGLLKILHSTLILPNSRFSGPRK